MNTRVLACVGSLMAGLAAGAAPEPLATRARGPVAIASSHDGATLYVANGRSGSLSVVDASTARVVAEHDLGRGLSAVVELAGGRLLVADGVGNALLLVEGTTGRVIGGLAVSGEPVSIAVLPDGSGVSVASRGGRRLTFLGIVGAPAESLSRRGSVELPFGPGAQVFVATERGPRLVVADGFGGQLAIVDPESSVLERVRSLPAHNIGGLAVSPDGTTLALSHQSLRRLARTTFEDIHWGSLVNNHARFLRVGAVVGNGSDAEVLRSGRVVDLGGTGNAAGDPGALVYRAPGELAVVLSGVNELGLLQEKGGVLRRVAVGTRPVALARSPDGGTLHVAEALADTVGVVDATAGVWRRSISLGPRPEPDAVARGERLFHDARLSHDGWMSCHSCHTHGHTNGLFADTLGDGSYGAPKRIPSLLGVADTGPWAWTGAFARLEDQARKSVETSMQGRPLTEEQAADLAAYLRTLAPPAPAPGPLDASAQRGRAAFEARGCVDCHAGAAFTSSRTHDVGVVDEVGNRLFNPPSLRGVGMREALFHDGRAASLADVFRAHRHPRGLELPPAEVDDLVAYLRSL